MCYNIDKFADTYLVTFGKEGELDLYNEVNEMEENSEWIPDIGTRDLRLVGFEPLDADRVAVDHDLDPADALDTAMDGSKTILVYSYNMEEIKAWPIRGCAFSGLCNAARLHGNSLGDMSVGKRAETINNGLEVGKNTRLLLNRYGKISACHSGRESAYMIMPISELLSITKSVVTEKMGRMEFMSGLNCHTETEAMWTLPEAQSSLVHMYQEAIKSVSGDSVYSVNFMPAVKFSSSDTAISAARLKPIFLTGKGGEIQLVDDIAVDHMVGKKDGEKLVGVDRYRAKVADIFAVFQASAEKIKELADIKIYHPENCLISICNKVGIGKKWGELAREQIEMFSISTPVLRAHDIYLTMCDMVAMAKEAGASVLTVNRLNEAVAKAVKADWHASDVGGTVAWENSKSDRIE